MEDVSNLPYQHVDPEPVPKLKKLKVKLPPKQEKSQASGMAMSDVASCKSMIKKLIKEKTSLMFRAPVGEYLLSPVDIPLLIIFFTVDPVKSGAPGLVYANGFTCLLY